MDYVNTMAFRLTWSSTYTEAVSSEAVQSGFVTKNWDAYSFNVSAERYENFLSTQLVPGNAVIIRHLPELSVCRGRPANRRLACLLFLRDLR